MNITDKTKELYEKNGIDKDMFVGLDIKLLASSDEGFQFQLFKHPLQPLITKQITQHMLQPGTLTYEIAVEHLGHHPLKHKHPSKHIAAIAFVFLLIIGTMC